MNCNCHCNGKCKLLGGLEQKIMDVLWSSKVPLKPAEVLKQIKGEYAYTTIMTVLKRMADKNLVTRTPEGNSFLYSPCNSKEKFACSCLDDLFSRLFASYGKHVVTAFKKSAKASGFLL